MSVMQHEAGDRSRPDRGEYGVVGVHNHGFGHSQAVCSCGWSGRRRYLKAAAQQDAWAHFARERCAVAVPLVIRVAG
jgi:hypothetical protein